MRQIKFRAWVRDAYMSYSHTNKGLGYLEFSNDGSTIIGEDDGDQRYENIPLMQFTNLLDKNGKEIYEGDVLLWKCSKSGSKKEKLHIVVIEWGGDVGHSYSLTIYDNGEKWGTSKSYWNASDREIIGNIWENEELLENK